MPRYITGEGDSRGEFELFDLSIPRLEDNSNVYIPRDQLIRVQSVSIVDRKIVMYNDGLGLNPLTDEHRKRGATFWAQREIILTVCNGRSNIKYFWAPGMDPKKEDYVPLITSKKKTKSQNL
jgi:hypothetical protein